ncbi:MAG: RNA methyltransferase [Thermodesulfobacteriota bacterium]|nr:RNA methyltransferase [Thermodesulfobacteriota bacterium]
MKKSYMPNIYIALTHYPVVNKNGSIIISAVTNLDLHDISRAAKTYGVQSLYVVTPMTDQKELVEKIVSHWLSGYGSTYNPERGKALELICIKDSLDDVIDHIRSKGEGSPEIVATCARDSQRSINCGKFREMLKSGRPYLLVFGTAWGLSKDFIAGADYILEPIKGNTGYNHLSVRSAAAIIFDRLMGDN